MRILSLCQLRVVSLLLALVSVAATCEEQPVVHLGRTMARAGSPAVAPTGGASGIGLGHDETKECEEYDPVCGIDGKTYQSACAALLSGVGVIRRGPC